MTLPRRLTSADVAALLGISRSGLANLRARDASFPEPVDPNALRHEFDSRTLQAWAAKHGRPLADALPERSEEAELRSGRIVPHASSGELTAWVVAAAGPVSGLVMDPACGFGGFLEAAAQGGAREVVGVDIDPEAAQITRDTLESLDVESTVLVADALDRDTLAEYDGRCSLVLSEPPFGPLPEAHRHSYSEYGRLPVVDQSYAWIDLTLRLLHDEGRAVVVTPARSLAVANRAESFRDGLVRDGRLLAVVHLPAGMRPGRASRLALWVLGPAPLKPAKTPTYLEIDGAELQTWVGPSEPEEKPPAHLKVLTHLLGDWARSRRLPEGTPREYGRAVRVRALGDEVPGAEAPPRASDPPTPELFARVAGPIAEQAGRLAEQLEQVAALARTVASGERDVQAVPLGDLVHSGAVEVLVPASNDKRRKGSRLLLHPIDGPVGPSDNPAQPGDVVVRQTDHGFESHIAVDSFRSWEGPVTVLRPHGDAAPSGAALRMAVAAARADVDLADARDRIVVLMGVSDEEAAVLATVADLPQGVASLLGLFGG